MSVQPVHHQSDPEPRVPRTADGIAAVLTGARRMEFYRELGQAEIGEVEGVLLRWWCEAMLDTDPEQDRIIQAARSGTLPTGTMDDVFRRRRERGGEMPGE
ncbi:hypothetical protein [Kitasatospora cathayae]|uniref:Uncharacterized protein n=1 Tax=Kitasatospora cathayae TaxID=3004092 RepID=A0ABY7QHC8_9ACTN|nr:hypothetical protein [Kitasatospora sp. HUAS 3-15]WBP92210.1 hypothetical protein O1G21_41110 [Kitasatospora sp. HUAS 3-15]